MALIHPQFDAVAFTIGGEGGWPVHWYGITYLAAFLMFLALGKYRAKTMPQLGFKSIELDDILFYGVLGVILGGRIGYVLFYKPADFLANPLDIFKVWQGGMSFHGGFLGVLVAMIWYARKTGRGFWQITDFIAPIVPLGLASGRFGNFINGELWCRVSDAGYSWLMLFPQAMDADVLYVNEHPASVTLLQQIGQYAMLPRHPSQIYQFLGEGVLLFVLLWLYARKVRPTMAVSAVFLMGYGVLRFLAEFAREPDDFLGLFAGFSMGQILSLPMIVLGAILLWRAYQHPVPEPVTNLTNNDLK